MACGAAAMDRRNYLRSCWHVAAHPSCNLGGLGAEHHQQTSASLKRSQTSKFPFCLCVFLKATHLHFVLSRSAKAGLLQLQPNFQLESCSAHLSSCVRSFTALDGVLMVASSRLSALSWEFKNLFKTYSKKVKKQASVDLEGNGQIVIACWEASSSVLRAKTVDPPFRSEEVILDSVLY